MVVQSADLRSFDKSIKIVGNGEIDMDKFWQLESFRRRVGDFKAMSWKVHMLMRSNERLVSFITT